MQYLNKFKFVSLCFLIIGSVLLFKPSYYYLKGYITQYILHDIWNKNKSNQKSLFEYLNLRPVGKLLKPDVNIDCIILDIINDKTLSYGLALFSNEVKTYNNNFNIVIAGHRDSYFNNLRMIEKGDYLHLEHIEGKSSYVVEDIVIDFPSNIEYVNKNIKNRITLITCYPFQYIGSAPLRYIVIGKLL